MTAYLVTEAMIQIALVVLMGVVLFVGTINNWWIVLPASLFLLNMSGGLKIKGKS